MRVKNLHHQSAICVLALLSTQLLHQSIFVTLAQANLRSSSPNPPRSILKNPLLELAPTDCSELVTFSEFPDGTKITTQYKNTKKIIFGGDSPFIASDGAQPDSPVLSGSPRFQGAIEGTFSVPIKPGEKSPDFVGGFSIDVGYFDSVGSTQLSWYDRQGKLLGKAKNTTLGIQRFVVELGDDQKEIYKWRIEPVGADPAGFSIDNVCINIGQAFQRIDFSSPKQKSPQDKKLPNVDIIPISIRPSDNIPIAGLNILRSNLNQLKQGRQPKIADNQAPLADARIVSVASCAGVGDPLNKTDLRNLAKKVLNNPKPSENTIGLIFENFAIASRTDVKNGVRFPSPERAIKTGGSLSNVVPDSVGSVVQILRIFGIVPILPLVFENSSFMDAKAYKEAKVINLSNSKYQSQGYLDYLGHQSQVARSILTNKVKPTPHLLYATTSDVAVGFDHLSYNGGTSGQVRVPVGVWQQVACQVVSGQNKLRLGRAVLLNPFRFNGRPITARISAVTPGREVPLRRP